MLARFRPQRWPRSRLFSQLPPGAEQPRDFRSPWFFRAVAIGNFIVIPIVGVYGVLYWDWADNGRETVVQPVRRWLKKQKEAFFRLSPTEQQLAGVAAPSTPSQAPDTADSTGGSQTGLSTAGLPKGFFKPFFLVKGVKPDGPAAVAGLRDDDLIVTFGDKPVRDLPPLTYQAMVQSAVDYNTTIPIVVFRAGQEISLSLSPTKEVGFGCNLQRFQPGQVNR
ncbi:hypothetical protein FB45DRAFT_896637 [Roridomyces roridus]|uniref:PDZ domain-containing protein n=1 Tax=Roridomyces roridus TaxID=1738132 RepID=A0AAD7CBE9_9AGAR|nr:hypothetical protein FB45DRAFT_896637 [Roridomyces roridus]